MFSFYLSCTQKDVDKLKRVWMRITKMVKGLRSLLYEERLRELDMFNLEEEGLGKMLSLPTSV